jgi:hypothetical protein
VRNIEQFRSNLDGGAFRDEDLEKDVKRKQRVGSLKWVTYSGDSRVWYKSWQTFP